MTVLDVSVQRTYNLFGVSPRSTSSFLFTQYLVLGGTSFTDPDANTPEDFF